VNIIATVITIITVIML